VEAAVMVPTRPTNIRTISTTRAVPAGSGYVHRQANRGEGGDALEQGLIQAQPRRVLDEQQRAGCHRRDAEQSHGKGLALGVHGDSALPDDHVVLARTSAQMT
jgi:hypothetical protein